MARARRKTRAKKARDVFRQDFRICMIFKMNPVYPVNLVILSNVDRGLRKSRERVRVDQT